LKAERKGGRGVRVPGRREIVSAGKKIKLQGFGGLQLRVLGKVLLQKEKLPKMRGEGKRWYFTFFCNFAKRKLEKRQYRGDKKRTILRKKGMPIGCPRRAFFSPKGRFRA